MIIRRHASTQQLITQPAHAALALRIMRRWRPSHFPDSPRKPSILNAIQEHDTGWADIDETLVVDEATGRLLDFTEVSDAVKRQTSSLGIERLSNDPYAAALVAQHRLHVYRRYAADPDWSDFFAGVTAVRDTNLRAAGESSLDRLLDDYRFVRAGDLASLAFCNNWPETAGDGCGYAMRFDGTSLVMSPDPFEGATIAFDIDAREIDNRSFASVDDARRAVAAARVVTLQGRAVGS